MTIGQIHAKLRKGTPGRFRRLQIGEPIEAGDIIVGLNTYDYPSPSVVGCECEKPDTIIRLEFDK